VILIYPLLLAVAALIVVRTEQHGSASWAGFLAWYTAGALFTLSLITGFSIGLFLLPLVTVSVALAVRAAPDSRAMLGFFAGSGLILVLIGIRSDSLSWLISGLALLSLAAASFAAVRSKGRERRYDSDWLARHRVGPRA
jgi:hypothetical protein